MSEDDATERRRQLHRDWYAGLDAKRRRKRIRAAARSRAERLAEMTEEELLQHRNREADRIAAYRQRKATGAAPGKAKDAGPRGRMRDQTYREEG